jgi:hypothetical protein
MKRFLYRIGLALVTALAASGLAGSLAAEPSPRIDPDTGLASWTLRDGAIAIELIQRLPDQTRAVFQGRGFPAAAPMNSPGPASFRPSWGMPAAAVWPRWS